MTNNEIRACVRNFKAKHSVKELSYDVLCDIAEQIGFTVVEFGDNTLDNEPSKILIDVLSLKSFAANSRGFTYAGGDYRLIFVQNSLSDKEKVIVLSHEFGHICCGHLNKANKPGQDVKEEYEANEFAHYLIKSCSAGKVKNKKVVIAVFTAVLVLAVSLGVTFTAYNNNKYYENYYVSAKGEKFHKQDCPYIAGRKGVHRLTKKEYNSGDYSPCKHCLPEVNSQ